MNESLISENGKMVARGNLKGRSITVFVKFLYK